METTHDDIGQAFEQVHSSQGVFNEAPLQLVLIFLKVNFYRHVPHPSFFPTDGVI